MSARRKRVISTEEIQFNHKPAKNVIDRKKKGVSQNGQTPSIIGICSYCVLDRPVFERCQTLLHTELTPWWSFPLANGAHHKKHHSPTHPQVSVEKHLMWKWIYGEGIRNGFFSLHAGSSRLHGPLTRYVILRVAHAPGMLGTFSLTANSKGKPLVKRSRHASRHVRHARAVMHVWIACPRWWGKRYRHSRCMRTCNFLYLARGPWVYISDKSLYCTTNFGVQALKG